MYDVKAGLTYKAKFVCDGSRVDPNGLSTRATVVKGVSVHLLDLIADSQNLSTLCGDIGNTFIQDQTKGKIYIRCGPKFGDRADCIKIVVRDLYCLTTSAEIFRAMFADILRALSYNLML